MPDIIPDGPWAGFDRDRAFEWETIFYDYWPSFPGASIMWHSYQAHSRGKFVNMPWARTARDAEAAGFTPATYALLRHWLGRFKPEEHAGHPSHGYGHGTDGQRAKPINFAEWGMWLELIRSGKRPSHATRIMLGWLDDDATDRWETEAAQATGSDTESATEPGSADQP